MDPTVMSAARDLAQNQRRSLGVVISELARKGLEAASPAGSERQRNGFPLFDVPRGAPSATTAMVKEILADEDLPS